MNIIFLAKGRFMGRALSSGTQNLRLILLVLAVLLLFPGLFQGGLSGYDDALYAHEGKQMARYGNWGTIQFNGSPNFEYPPLFVWLEAISIKTLGASDFAAKFPSAILGLGTILLVYFLAQLISANAFVALYSAGILMTTQYFVKASTHAMTDVPFTFFFTLALLLYLKGLRQPEYFPLCGLAIGLAILTRSVIGLIPLVIILAHLAVIRGCGIECRRHLLIGALLSLALPSVWFAYEFMRYGAPFMMGHFGFVARKLSSSETSGNWRPVANALYYVKFLLKYYWPWLPLMLFGLRGR